MTKKAQTTYTAAAVIVVLVAGFLLFKKKPSTESQATPQNSGQSSITPQSEQKPTNPVPDGSSTWEGILKASNSPKKGNLMLVTKDRTIYIKTSRDFSSLLDKEVVVTYEGTLESFALGDIVAK